jgi:hypothetical protein
MNKYEAYLWAKQDCSAPKEQCVQVNIPVYQWTVSAVDHATATVTLSPNTEYERPDTERVRDRLHELYTVYMQRQRGNE